jgi:hypothetical protein
MNRKHSNTPEINGLVENIVPLVKHTQQLARQAAILYSREIDAIIQNQESDSRRIEHCLDGILDFCFDEKMLQLFKKLCRYYYNIDSVATSEYVYFYKEMWDNDK